MIVASIITLFIIALAVLLGLQAGRKKTMTMEQWAVGGRNFGAIFLWLLLAGEIYTTFTFLGAAGYAYAKGGPVFYILGYGALGYVLSYFFLPPSGAMPRNAASSRKRITLRSGLRVPGSVPWSH